MILRTQAKEREGKPSTVSCVLVPVLGRQKQKNPWGLVASYPGLMDKLLNSETSCLKNKVDSMKDT